MPFRIRLRDMFWFALFHVGALVAVAVFSGCAGGPFGHFSGLNKEEALAERQTRMQFELGKARMHEQADEHEKARQVYERLVLQFPEQSEPFYRLAVSRDREKKHGDAQRLYQRALQLDPGNPEVMNSLGYSYFLSGNLELARQMQEQAVARDPGNKLFRNNLGMTLGHLQMYQPALDQFVAAGGEDDAYYNLAFVYSTQGKFEQAKECFRRTMEVNPRHEAARTALESFERFERNPDAMNETLLAADGKRGYWEAYKEDGAGEAVAQAAHAEDVSGLGRPVQVGAENLSASTVATQSQLQARAAAMMARKNSTEMRDNAASRAGLSAADFGQ